ncbi:hypothetical protein D3C85_1754110 [compost metagenome]
MFTEIAANLVGGEAADRGGDLGVSYLIAPDLQQVGQACDNQVAIVPLIDIQDGLS